MAGVSLDWNVHNDGRLGDELDRLVSLAAVVEFRLFILMAHGLNGRTNQVLTASIGRCDKPRALSRCRHSTERWASVRPPMTWRFINGQTWRTSLNATNHYCAIWTVESAACSPAVNRFRFSSLIDCWWADVWNFRVQLQWWTRDRSTLDCLAMHTTLFVLHVPMNDVAINTSALRGGKALVQIVGVLLCLQYSRSVCYPRW